MAPSELRETLHSKKSEMRTVNQDESRPQTGSLCILRYHTTSWSGCRCPTGLFLKACHSVFGHETQDVLDSDSSLWQLHSRDLGHKYPSVMPAGIFIFPQNRPPYVEPKLECDLKTTFITRIAGIRSCVAQHYIAVLNVTLFVCAASQPDELRE